MIEDEFILTKSQSELQIKLDKFLKSSDRIFLIEGPPGTGKTTVNKITLKEYIDADIKTNAKGSGINIAGITLAHAAKNILGKHIPNVFTFASAYGMKETFNDDGSRSFVFNSYQETIPIGHCSLPVFVHDEVSQYNTDMIKIMLEKTPIFSKIILIGDKAQLPPIEPKESRRAVDSDSAIFDLDLPESCKHTLTEIVRQKEGNPILELSRFIRKEIFGSQNIVKVLEELRVPKIKDGIGYSHVNYGNDLYEHIESRNYLDTAVIAFRKKTVGFFNSEIRNYLLKNPEENIIKNDIICMLDNYYHKTEGKFKEIEYVLHNSDVFKIDKVFVKNIKHYINNKLYKTEVYSASLVNEKTKRVIIPTEVGIVQLEKSLEYLAKLCNARKLKWHFYWEFRKRFCNCSYGYAITAYKCQGSTYKSVYIDINDILMTGPLSTKRKLQTIYTAMTRASEDVYFLTQRNYGSS